MGNRGGRLHSDDKRLLRRQSGRAWICCVLSFKGRQRQVMGPGYTELFFWDEACALAAGHRPCFECRRQDALRFSQLWSGGVERARAPDMDRVLAQARKEGPWPASDVPDGAIVLHQGRAALAWQGVLYPWSDQGYGAAQAKPAELTVLTPKPICTVLDRGYCPQVGLKT